MHAAQIMLWQHPLGDLALHFESGKKGERINDGNEPDPRPVLIRGDVLEGEACDVV